MVLCYLQVGISMDHSCIKLFKLMCTVKMMDYLSHSVVEMYRFVFDQAKSVLMLFKYFHEVSACVFIDVVTE